MQLTQTNRRNNRLDFLGHITKPQALSETGAFLFSESQTLGEFQNLKEQVGQIKKHYMTLPKRFHQSGNSSLKSERNNDVTDKSFTSKMAKFVSLDGHFTKFS